MFLGIDFGTSGCRAVIIDEHQVILASARQALPEATSSQGKISQAVQYWLNALHRLLADLAAKIDLGTIRRIALDGTSGSVLICDSAGTPLTDALMYNDVSSVHVLTTLRRHCPFDQHVTMTASSGLAKAIQLGEAFCGRDIRILNQADFISNTLAGNWGYSDEHNVLKLGYDIQNRCWPDWVERLLPAHSLPTVLLPGQVYARISPAFQRRFGFSQHCEICVGSTDANAAFIATGANQVGDAVTSLGSTLVLKVLNETPVSALASGVYSHRLGDLYLVSGASNAGGAILRQYFSDEEIRKLSKQMDIDHPSGLDYYPLTKPGERFPFNDPTLPPRLTPRPDSNVLFLQGLLEGLTRIEKAGYDKLQQLGVTKPARILSCGGGASNPTWQALRENLLGIPVSRAVRHEACFGAALLALKCGIKA